MQLAYFNSLFLFNYFYKRLEDLRLSEIRKCSIFKFSNAQIFKLLIVTFLTFGTTNLCYGNAFGTI